MHTFRQISQMSPVILTVLRNKYTYIVSNVSARNDKKWREFTSKDVRVCWILNKTKEKQQIVDSSIFHSLLMQSVEN